MKKYKGNLTASNFLKQLNNVSGKGVIVCTTCNHHNGECVYFARKGTCKLYDTYGSVLVGK